MVPAEPDECPFEYQPFEGLFNRALRDVADRRLHQMERKAAARALAFCLRERLVTEAVATDVLAALRKSLDVSNVVRTLLIGLVGVSAPEKIAEWTTRTAERALTEGHVPSFVSALRVLVDLRDYDGAMRTSWQVAVLRAVELPDRWLRALVFLFRDGYARRFGATSRWVRTIAVHRLVEALPARPDHDADLSADAGADMNLVPVSLLAALLYCVACDAGASTRSSPVWHTTELPADVLPAPSATEPPSSVTTTPPASEPAAPECTPPLRINPRTLSMSWPTYLGRRVSLLCHLDRRIDLLRTLIIAGGARFVVSGSPNLDPCGDTTSTFVVLGSTTIPIAGRTVLPELLLEGDGDCTR